jgi:hypothetical protein
MEWSLSRRTTKENYYINLTVPNVPDRHAIRRLLLGRKESRQLQLINWLTYWWAALGEMILIANDNLDIRLLEMLDSRDLTGDSLVREAKQYESN